MSSLQRPGRRSYPDHRRDHTPLIERKPRCHNRTPPPDGSRLSFTKPAILAQTSNHRWSFPSNRPFQGSLESTFHFPGKPPVPEKPRQVLLLSGHQLNIRIVNSQGKLSRMSDRLYLRHPLIRGSNTAAIAQAPAISPATTGLSQVGLVCRDEGVPIVVFSRNPLLSPRSGVVPVFGGEVNYPKRVWGRLGAGFWSPERAEKMRSCGVQHLPVREKRRKFLRVSGRKTVLGDSRHPGLVLIAHTRRTQHFER